MNTLSSTVRSDSESLLTSAEVAEALRVSRRTVIRLAQRGELPALRFGAHSFRIRQSDLEAFIRSREVVGSLE